MAKTSTKATHSAKAAGKKAAPAKRAVSVSSHKASPTGAGRLGAIYAMTPGEAVKIAKRAGILTASGNLTSFFK